MFEVSFRWKGRCPRHPRFRPEQGRGAVRAGCLVCDALVAVAEAEATMRMLCARVEFRAAEAAAVDKQIAERRTARKGAAV